MQYLGFIQNIGVTELVIVFVVVLLIFGPKSLPKLGKSLGQGIREFKDATNKMSESIMKEDEDERPRQTRDRIPAEPPPAAMKAEEKETEKVS